MSTWEWAWFHKAKVVGIYALGLVMGVLVIKGRERRARGG